MAHLQGEFWLIDGTAVYADGDVGDINHEGMVIQQLTAELVEEVNDECGSRLDSEYVDMTRIEDVIRKHLDMDPMDRDQDKIENFIIEELQFPKVKLDVINGQVGAREYGFEVLGWKRVAGSSVETQTLSNHDLKEIADGLWDAYQEQVEENSFNIEVRGNGRYYDEVPWSVVSGDDIKALQEYHRYQGKLRLLKVR